MQIGVKNKRLCIPFYQQNPRLLARKINIFILIHKLFFLIAISWKKNSQLVCQPWNECRGFFYLTYLFLILTDFKSLKKLNISLKISGVFFFKAADKKFEQNFKVKKISKKNEVKFAPEVTRFVFFNVHSILIWPKDISYLFIIWFNLWLTSSLSRVNFQRKINEA